ncbi:MAG: YicC family protein [Bacteroidetes bacterium]|nr:YicC family protein [Bacteroidota bacterium]MDA0922349.1 YicC family protein [Bacteroidota bacterium]MDA1288279.1 YicC family protein [Bacteroidota bacterium]
MILSMTGYGKSEVQWEDKNIRIEIRSLNSKTADINLRIPSYLRELESELRKRITQLLFRGKIDVSIYVEYNGGNAPTIINSGMVSSYMKQLEAIAEASESERMAMALRLPDTLNSSREELGEAEKKRVIDTLNQTLETLIGFRKDEGEVLEQDFLLRLDLLEQQLSKIKVLEPERKERVQTKIANAMAELRLEVDSNRFEQELIYYLEKLDITEEQVRLQNHLSYFRDVLKNEFPNGKKLGFITQEIGREINTIGSKANHAELQKCVVQMKDELEKVKEQLLNVL